MSLIFLTCRETVDLLTELQEGTLSAGQAFRVRLHLALCPPCKALFQTLAMLPGLAREELLDPEPLTPELEVRLKATLDQALARLGDTREMPALEDGLPEQVKAALAKGTDASWKLFLESHRAMAMGQPGSDETSLPDTVLQQLPPKSQWLWKRIRFTGTRVARLMEDVQAQSELLLLYIAPNGRIPSHTHLGSEAVLVLDGEMEDGDVSLATGDLHWFEKGSRHAQRIGPDGCWCLMRLEKPGFQIHGVSGLLA